jgi:hypothetical protein
MTPEPEPEPPPNKAFLRLIKKYEFGNFPLLLF